MSDQSYANPPHDPLATITAFHQASSRYSWELEDTAYQGTSERSILLPSAALPDAALGDCLSDRLSCRRFDPAQPVYLETLSMLLHLAYGHIGAVEALGRMMTVRPVPSASGFYALDMLVFARRVEGAGAAIYRFDPARNTLDAIAALPDRATLGTVFIDQTWVMDAPVTLVITGKPAAVAERYYERAYRFMLLEAGHVGQNLVLGAAALGLGCCPIGGFEDYRLCRAAGLDAEKEWPLYAASIGVPDPDYAADPRKPEGYDALV